MLKEFHEQPRAGYDTTGRYAHEDRIYDRNPRPDAEKLFKDVRNIHIVACGTQLPRRLVRGYCWQEQTGACASRSG